MQRSVQLLTVLTLVTGCIPLRQATRVNGPERPHVLLCDDRYLLVEVDLNRETLVSGQSYVADPAGKRYFVQVEPHQFDIEQRFEKLRAEVHPCSEDGSKIRRWANGIWAFHFVVQSNGVPRVIDQQWKYWTLYFNPILHGPPN